MKSVPMRNSDQKGYFGYPLHIRLLYIDIFPPSDILILNTVGIEGSGSHQADPCDFLIAGVDFFVRQSYLMRRKAVFHLYHDSPPLIPYRRRSLFFAPSFLKMVPRQEVTQRRCLLEDSLTGSNGRFHPLRRAQEFSKTRTLKGFTLCVGKLDARIGENVNHSARPPFLSWGIDVRVTAHSVPCNTALPLPRTPKNPHSWPRQ